jgi:uncharacterized iron-regulated protein
VKYLYDIKGWDFKKNISLEDNVAYWARRSFRECQMHRQLKSEKKDMADKIYHGVTAHNKFQTARMLKTIAKLIKNLKDKEK